MIKANRSARTAVGEEIDSLKSDMQQLRADLAGLAEALIQAGKSEAGEARSKLEERVQEQLEHMRSAVTSAQHYGRHGIESVQTQIEEKPFTSVLVAFAAGLMFGKLMDRR
ncbi:MAG: hypothetical protein AMXMBFR13_04960 [Phycisphaerae bacterium]|jgi:ElaB/YqjD/DUF883 family membrane-anchored ribosome-binding protein